MPKYLIERRIPGAGSMTPEQLQEAAVKSCSVLRDLGPSVQWIHSYVTDNTIHCVYYAENEELVRAHARESGFPADNIMTVRTIIEPATAEGPSVPA
jgi:hypothetical protein